MSGEGSAIQKLLQRSLKGKQKKQLTHSPEHAFGQSIRTQKRLFLKTSPSLNGLYCAKSIQEKRDCDPLPDQKGKEDKITGN